MSEKIPDPAWKMELAISGLTVRSRLSSCTRSCQCSSRIVPAPIIPTVRHHQLKRQLVPRLSVA
jgi:hypothetical protein